MQGTVGHSLARFSNSMTSRKRSRSRCWFFTWNNPPDGCWAQFDTIFNGVEYVVQLEDAGTPHLQGVIRYTNPRERVQEDLFGLCHWEVCRNWRAAVKYCTKVQSRIMGPWTNIEGLSWRATLKDPLADKELYGWQSDILNMIGTEPDDRTVYWYWDPVGCVGKTSLAKHICLKWGAKAMYLNGCNKDILFGVATRLEDEDLQVCLFGLSRQDADYMSYKSLEQIKDGIFYSGKYESRMCMFNPPHVIVFANFPPDVRMLSDDRWTIYRIDDGEVA